MGAPLPAQDQTVAQAAAAGAALTGVLVGALAGIPIAGPIAAGIAMLGVAIANVFGGCGQTCVQATAYANQTEPLLKQNLAAYLAAPVHYASLQAAALNNADTAINALRAACSNPALGDAGRRCISDRLVEGAVTSWCDGRVGCDWITAYRNPIANDPNVVPDPVPAPVAQAGSTLLSAVGVNPSFTIFGVPAADLVLPGLLVLGGFLL